MRIPQIVLLLACAIAARPACAQPIAPCGDCDGDTVVGILDALAASQHSVALRVLVSPAFEQCNVRGTLGGPLTPGAVVDVLDALGIAQFAVGLPVALDCASQPVCVLTGPAGATVFGAVDLDFELTDLDGDASTLSFEWSSDAGVTWNPATGAPVSPLGNPAAGVLPGGGLLFVWDSAADASGFFGGVELRLTADDLRTPAANCTTTAVVDNVNRTPVCNFGSPLGGSVAGDVALSFDTTDREGDALAVTLEFDSGGGLTLATLAVGGLPPLDTNPAIGVLPGLALGFQWDSVADVPAQIAAVRLRITVDDGQLASSCEVFVDVDNGTDLTVVGVDVTGPVSLEPFQSTTVARMLTNLGTLAAAGFTERVALSLDAVLDPGDQVLGDFAVGGLAAGATDASPRMVTLAGSTLPGVYSLLVLADSGDVIAELDESNNLGVSAGTVTVTSRIDIEVTSVVGRLYATMGLPRRFDRTLSNLGPAPTPGFEETWYLSDDAVIDVGDLQIATFAHAGLAAGQVETTSRDMQIPAALAPGDYFVGVIVDKDQVLGESDETNNAGAANPAVPIIVEVVEEGSLAAPLGVESPASPGFACVQPAGVTAVALVVKGTYDGTGEDIAVLNLVTVEDPAGTALLDGTMCPPTGKTYTLFEGSAKAIVAPNGDTTEHAECGTLMPFANPSEPAQSGTYLLTFLNDNAGPAPEDATVEVTSVRKFDPDSSQGTLYLNLVVVGDFLADDAVGAGAGDIADVLTRLQDHFTPFAITVVAEVHTIGGALGNSLEVVDYRDDANGNGIADVHEALDQLTPLPSYEPGNTALNVFLVRSILPGGIAGVASGIPGVPILQGTTSSGVIASQFGGLFSDMSAGGRQVLAVIIAHEIGHEVGLWHVTEFSGDPNHDPIPDTPRCMASPISLGGCTGMGRENVMFPQVTTTPVPFSTQQGWIMNHGPCVR